MQLEKFASDSTVFDFDCTNLLAADETISAPPVMSVLPAFPVEDARALIFGEPVVNTIPIRYPDGRVMAIGKGFQVRISAGLASNETQMRVYAVLGVFNTSAGNSLTTKAPLWLLPPGLVG